jgi:hypothetical protein
MSDTSVGIAGIDARQSMIRVWMALSAVWVGFWLLIAAIVLATVEGRYPLWEELGPFLVIVLTRRWLSLAWARPSGGVLRCWCEGRARNCRPFRPSPPCSGDEFSPLLR